jgi:hypothetical protein
MRIPAKRRIALLGLAVLGAAAVPNKADANFIVTFVNTTPSGSNHLWNYTVELSDNSRANLAGSGSTGPGAVNPAAPAPGDFFTIYDFAGFTGFFSTTGLLNTDFTVTSTIFGATPGTTLGNPNDTHFQLQSPADSPSFMNITLRKTGGTDTINTGGSSILLGTLSLESTVNLTAIANYTTADHTALSGGGPGNNLSESATSNITVPDITAIPEPTSMALTAIGMGSLVVVAARKRARRPVAVEDRS